MDEISMKHTDFVIRPRASHVIYEMPVGDLKLGNCSCIAIKNVC